MAKTWASSRMSSQPSGSEQDELAFGGEFEDDGDDLSQSGSEAASSINGGRKTASSAPRRWAATRRSSS
ncbi:hypothetical protein JCM3770_002792 [Rhodotorula araucariae]